jgi:CRP/FNR family cyclic AMP-dependent transcriptional regulator
MNAIGAVPAAPVKMSELLAATELFGGLSAAALSELADACRWRTVGAGQRIFSRGEPGSVMYVVVRGAVAITVSTAAGDELILDVLRPPATFGELSLIDGGVRIATATVHQPGILAWVPDPAIQRLLRRDFGFALAMLTALAQLVRRIDDRLADRTLLDLRARVVKYLTRAAESAGGASATAAEAASELRVEVPLSQADLAQLVGGSRQQVNRIIVDLERCGGIRRRGSQIISIAPRAILDARSRR